MSRTYRKLVGGVVPDGQQWRHWAPLRGALQRRSHFPRATRICPEDSFGLRCGICNSTDKRKRVPRDIKRAELDLLEYEARLDDD